MIQNQYKLLKEIQEKGYNVVTCGECGYVLIHTTDLVVIDCPHCGHDAEICDFPDLFFSGWKEENEKVE